MTQFIAFEYGELRFMANVIPSPNANAPELFVYLVSKDCTIKQDIAVIRPHLDTDNHISSDNQIDVLVFGDEHKEDYTEKHVINAIEDEE